MGFKRFQVVGVAVVFALAALVLAPVGAWADLNKCAKEFSKNAAKGVSDAQKEIQKCVDGVQKELDKGATGSVDKAADKCEAGIVKIGGIASDVGSDPKSKLGKVVQKIKDADTKGKCSVAEATTLGYPGGNFDGIGRQLAANALRQAWELQLQTNAASASQMLEAATAAGLAGGCPSCSFFVPTSGGPPEIVGPCTPVVCTQSGTLINTTAFGNYPIPVPLTGTVDATVCNMPNIMPNAVTLHGETSPGNIALAGGATVCVDALSARGAIATAGGSFVEAVDTQACADHDLSSDDCTQDGCQVGSSNSGDTKTCITSTGTGTAGAGEGYLSWTQRLTVHVSPATCGPDTICCNSDDTATPGAPVSIAFTTGTATADIFDGGIGGSFGTINNSVSVSGAAFADPARISGGTWAGAFSTIDDDGEGIGDGVTDVSLGCL